MIPRRTALAVAGLGLAVALTGCTSGGGSEQPTPTGSTPATATTSAAAPTPSVETTRGALVAEFPAAIEQLPDSEIVSSTVDIPTRAAGDSGDSEHVAASLVQRTDKSVDEILDFYTESLAEHGFEPVGEPTSQDDVTSLAFHSTDGNQTVSVGISPDPDDDNARLVTVGGVVNK